jgi:cytochrome c
MKAIAAVAAIGAFVLIAHLSGLFPVFRSHVTAESGWQQFRTAYQLSEFGEDGHFVRAAQNGYNVFYFTHRYAWRFTRKSATDAHNACASCHRPEDLAYAFVNSDRYDPRSGKRFSFEERVMRCFAEHMDGFVPTLYDPTVRDLRILARAVAHHMQLGEGALPSAEESWRAAR